MNKKKRFKVNWKYAIGEVLLIFLGITLAITFENVRQQKKDKATELILLKELLIDEQRNCEDMNVSLFYFEKAKSGCDYILYSFQNPLFDSNLDSVFYHFKNIRYSPLCQLTKSTYKAMESIGWQIISNDTLRTTIINLYDYYYDALEELHEHDRYVTTTHYLPLYYSISPISRNENLSTVWILNNPEAIKTIINLQRLKGSVIEFIHTRLEKSEELQKAIKMEIENL